MNAIDLLEKQHREIELLLDELEETGDGAPATRDLLCCDLSDQLAVHAEIVEKILCPGSRQENVEELLRRSIDDHLAMKRLVADILESGAEHPLTTPRWIFLRKQIERHIEREERDLFARVRRSCSMEELEEMGRRMEDLTSELLSQGELSPGIAGHPDAPAGM